MERTVEIYIGDASDFNSDNLYRVDGYTVSDSGEIYHLGEKIKQYFRQGYKYVILPIDGKNKRCKVHRIVATTFRDICGDFNEVVNHLDENKENNSAYNLQWTTHKINLSWGNIDEKKKESIKINHEIKNIVKELYSKNNIIYHVGVKIRRLKTCYKIIDKKNGIRLYTLGKSFVFNKKRGSIEMFN